MEFSYSSRTIELLQRIKAFMLREIEPMEADFMSALNESNNPWVELPVITALKEKAKLQGLWNLSQPGEVENPVLSHVEFAPLAEQMGHSFLAAEVFNCNAPDSGNMDVLRRHGTKAQCSRWLIPLMNGTIRSAFCMTEPGVASSDATNMELTITLDGDEVVISGKKWWSTGVGHPNCELLIVMGLTDATADRHLRHSIVLVPRHCPGVHLERLLPVFNFYDPPYGHGEISFRSVRVPRSNIIGDLGHGFSIAQSRLGPGRIHHCMRAIGAAERTLNLLVKRAKSRKAFKKSLAELGGNMDIIADARIGIEQARLLVLKTAWLLDTVGARAAKGEIAQIKVAVPIMLQKIVDEAIQLHGAAGLSNDFPLASIYSYARSLRIVDGPDAVHRRQIAMLELSE